MVSSKCLPGGVAFALQVLGGVDAALRAHRVRALYRDDREQVNLAAHLGDLDDGGEAGQAAAHHDNFRSCHLMNPICSALRG
jgi:L-aminopeptidase/D-esterase-like protein